MVDTEATLLVVIKVNERSTSASVCSSVVVVRAPGSSQECMEAICREASLRPNGMLREVANERRRAMNASKAYWVRDLIGRGMNEGGEGRRENEMLTVLA